MDPNRGHEQQAADDLRKLCDIEGLDGRAGGPAVERNLGPYVRRVIQRVLRSGRAASPFERRVLSEVRKLTRTGAVADTGDRETLVRLLSGRICQAMTPCLAEPDGPARGVKDTSRPTGLRTVL